MAHLPLQVYIAIPTRHHYAWAMRSLQAGKHVLVEKPVASNATEAKRLVAAACAHGVVLMEGYHYR